MYNNATVNMYDGGGYTLNRHLSTILLMMNIISDYDSYQRDLLPSCALPVLLESNEMN